MKKRTLNICFLFLIVFMLCAMVRPFSAAATTVGIYENCILADDFADGISRTISVTPVGKLCYEICERECNALSRTENNFELNGDIILSCKKACREGNEFSTSRLRTSANVIDSRTYSIGAKCSQAPNSQAFFHYPHDSGVIVEQDEKIAIKLRGTTNSLGGIAMCGVQQVFITPSFRSMDYDAFSNYVAANSSSFNSDPSTWNARNANTTNTGIIFRNGDYLRIEYSGDFRFRCNTTTKSCTEDVNGDHHLKVRRPGIYNFSLPFSESRFLRLPGGNLVQYQRQSDGTIPNYAAATAANRNVTWYGLQGSLYFSYNDSGLNDSDPSNDFIDTNGIRTTRFEGIVDGFSNTYNVLGIMHYDEYNPGNWLDNLGGLDINILKLGCLFENGERLQYAITQREDHEETRPSPNNDDYPVPSESDWVDVPTSTSIQHQDFPSPKAGKVWLRIEPYDASEDSAYFPSCSTSDAACLAIAPTMQNSYYGPGNTYGRYFVEVVRLKSDAFGSNVLSDTIRKIRSYFFGANGSEGIVQSMFNRFVSNSDLVELIRVFMVLFMAFTGLAYIIGIAKMTQRDAIIRLVSLGMVVTLLAPDSWEFFNTYLFQLFINGGLELMANVINYTEYGLPADSFARVQDDPALVFTALDKPLAILFGAKTWIKIYALVMSSPVGFLLAIAILYAGVIYAVTILKAMIIYVVSLIFMAILLLLAPVFISFVLFGYTRKMFITWLQQLMSVTLQPVVVIAALGIFSTLILAGLYVALGYTVCESCYFSIYFPGAMDNPFCIWPGWVTVYSMHQPSGTILPPIVGIAASFYFLIMAQGAYVFVSDIVNRINQIISGFFLGINLTGYTNLTDYTSSPIRTVGGLPNYLLGNDQVGQAHRRNLKSFEKNTLGNFVTGTKRGYNNPNPTSWFGTERPNVEDPRNPYEGRNQFEGDGLAGINTPADTPPPPPPPDQPDPNAVQGGNGNAQGQGQGDDGGDKK